MHSHDRLVIFMISFVCIVSLSNSFLFAALRINFGTVCVSAAGLLVRWSTASWSTALVYRANGPFVCNTVLIIFDVVLCRRVHRWPVHHAGACVAHRFLLFVVCCVASVLTVPLCAQLKTTHARSCTATASADGRSVSFCCVLGACCSSVCVYL